MEQTNFKAAEEGDLTDILEVYNHYIITTTANFRSAPVSPETLRSIIFLDHARFKTYLIDADGEMAGFCFLTQFRNVDAYDRTVEIGTYLRPGFTRRGLGTRALKHLERVAAESGFKTIVASVSGENTASIALLTKLGYEKCAHFQRVAEKFGRVLDLVYFQMSLEEAAAGS